MGRKATYTQLKAKKDWLLYTSSDRKKSKRKSRISSCKARVRTTTNTRTSVSRLPVESCHIKRSFLDILLNITWFSRLESEPIENKEAFGSNPVHKWKFFGLECLSSVDIPGVNMATDAMMHGAHCVRFCVDKTCKNINVLRDAFVERLKNSLKGIELCKERLKQKSAFIFPSQSFKRKFDEMNERINDLEMEIKRMKTNNSQNSSCPNCQCDGHSKTSNIPHIPLPPPPPPGPPPPPPPPPPVLTMEKIQKTNSSKSSVQSNPVKESKNPQAISLDDIKSIKLKKVSRGSIGNKSKRSQEEPDISRKPLREISNDNRKSMNLKGQNGLPLVTLKDLQKVKLKRKRVESEDATFKSPENNMVVLRTSLRKVNMKRSPGGTPLNRPVQETGAGLTPLMTRALKKKFKLANAVSPDSPTYGRKIKLFSLSPPESASTSPFSISPLAIR